MVVFQMQNLNGSDMEFSLGTPAFIFPSDRRDLLGLIISVWYQLSLSLEIHWLCSPNAPSFSKYRCQSVWLWLRERPQPGHTHTIKALLYLRQLSSVSSPFAVYDCPISVCHRTAVLISSIYPFSTCIQPRGIVKQIIVLILATFQVPIISDPVLTFTVQFGSQVMLIKLDMPSGVVFRLVGTFKAGNTYRFIWVWSFMPHLMAFGPCFSTTCAWLLFH